MKMSTELAQNSIARILKDVELGDVRTSSTAIKRQYSKAKTCIEKARLELDTLNDMKQGVK